MGAPITHLVEGGTMTLLPAKPGTCEVCATEHDPEQPHNAQSLFYQVRHQMEHGRGADWRDAMAHCSAAVRAVWTAALEGRGIDVAGGKVNP